MTFSLSLWQAGWIVVAIAAIAFSVGFVMAKGSHSDDDL
jgi:hypothetical protein